MKLYNSYCFVVDLWFLRFYWFYCADALLIGPTVRRRRRAWPGSIRGDTMILYALRRSDFIILAEIRLLRSNLHSPEQVSVGVPLGF